LEKQGKFDEAIEKFEEALKIDNNVSAHFN
jgi:tetratricopeptide (TPR) repeat protein